MLTDYFYINLNGLMNRNGLNRSSLARAINIPVRTIIAWYARKSMPSPETIEELAAYFKVEPHYFFMKPGTQNESTIEGERYTEMELFFNEIADRALITESQKLSWKMHGLNGFFKMLKNNYENDQDISFVDWQILMMKELNKYTSVDMLEKLKKVMSFTPEEKKYFQKLKKK